MQPKLHFLRTSHPRQQISHAMCFLQLLPNHSDEFVQDLHLFPFYPAHTSPCKAALYGRHQRSFYETFYILAYCAFIYNAKIASFTVIFIDSSYTPAFDTSKKLCINCINTVMQRLKICVLFTFNNFFDFIRIRHRTNRTLFCCDKICSSI